MPSLDRARERSGRAVLALLAACAVLALGGATRQAPGKGKASDPGTAALESITADEVRAHLVALASGTLEGRDTPSLGLSRAAEHLQRALETAGLRGAGKDGSYRLPFELELPAPDAARCALSWSLDGSEQAALTLGTDYVPYPGQDGSAEGELVFLGFGIDGGRGAYNDVKGELKGKIALVLEGEPAHKTLFEGAEISEYADLRAKLARLESAGVAGVLVARTPPRADGAPEAERPAVAGIGFRSTFAQWPKETPREPLRAELPVLELRAEAASLLLGESVLELAAAIEKSGKPLRRDPPGRSVRLRAASSKQRVAIDNVGAILPGSDAQLASQYVVLGAHYDHIGVDARGRIGYGADDNGSGCAALLELAQAVALQPLKRSVLVLFFAGEEDGLLGSQALCRNPPVPLSSMAAMLNLDMLGRGKVDEVAVLGTDQNPGFEKLLQRAQRVKAHRVKRVLIGQARELWERSDHASFHAVGVPTLFFFESGKVDDNPDYHTWRDTLDQVDAEKVARSARLALVCAQLIGNDEERPPAPRGR
jgi:hypothetical protein